MLDHAFAKTPVFENTFEPPRWRERPLVEIHLLGMTSQELEYPFKNNKTYIAIS